MRRGVITMQTILKVVCNNRDQAGMVDDYIVRFCAKAADEAHSIEFPSPDPDDVAFARDDAHEFPDNCDEKLHARLGSFGQWPNQANSKLQIIFVNPMILSYRPNGPTLRFWVASPSPGTAGNPESD